jgi:hypothetical protein
MEPSVDIIWILCTLHNSAGGVPLNLLTDPAHDSHWHIFSSFKIRRYESCLCTFCLFPAGVNYGNPCIYSMQICLSSPVFLKTFMYMNHTQRHLFVRDQVSGWVGIAIGYGLDGPGSIPDRGKRFFFSTQHPDRLWCPPSLLSNGYWGLFPRGVKLTTHLQSTSVSPTSYHSTSASYSSSIRGCYSGPFWGHSSKGLGLTPLPELV